MPAAERQLRWSPEAESDLREIWRYYASVASPEVANNLLRELRKAGGRAAERPFLYRPRERPRAWTAGSDCPPVPWYSIEFTNWR